MAIIGSLLKKGISLADSLEQQFSANGDLQRQELQKLLIKAHKTKFGVNYGFLKILEFFKQNISEEYYRKFTEHVPIHDYEKMYNSWWQFAKAGETNVSWPGKIKYFALSSGTSGSSSKYIPISKDIFKSMKKTSVRQILSMSNYALSEDVFSKRILMLGGSTSLTKSGDFYQGDLSGISASKMPFWLQFHYKPGKKIAAETNWEQKLTDITLKAKDWDIGIVVGVPSWIQLLFEKIIEYYKVESIHDVWPNLSVFVHGGVAYEPYKTGFSKLISKPWVTMETYLASEGYFAYQVAKNKEGMKLVLNGGVFYEFIPFNQQYFDNDGNLKKKPKTLTINKVEENQDYAMLISTNAGAWRYLIGDVVRFVCKTEAEIKIVGRTKQFLNSCGEHLSIDNINQAIFDVGKKLAIDICEFTVTAYPRKTKFVHHWYLGINNDASHRPELIKVELDNRLKELNDDYAVERTTVLSEVKVELYPTSVFYNWMDSIGKLGGQNKFPRVLKGDKYVSWKQYISGLNN